MKFVEFNAVDDVDPEQWRTLWERSRDATVFQTQAWMRAWTAVFAPSRDDVKLITAWEDARLIGIAPIARSALHARGGEGEWAFLGDDYSDYQVFLAWDDSPDIIEEMLDAVLRSVPYTAKLALRDVPQYSTLGLLLAERSSQTSSMLTAEEFTACPTLRLIGNEAGTERVLAKSSVRRCERGLKKLGQVTVEHVTRSAEIKDSLPGLFAQHIRRWSDTPHPSLFLKPENQRFFHVAASAMQSDALLYSTVRLDDHVVAQHFGLRSKGSLLWYKPAFDIGFRQHSPGEVLIASLIRYAREQDFKEFDFTRGEETFKSRFASVVSYNRSFLWHRDRLSLWRRKAAHTKARITQTLSGSRTEPRRLGGLASMPNGSNRALILDASNKTGVDFAVSLASHGVEVHATGNGQIRFGEDVTYLDRPSRDDAGKLVEWLAALCREHDYSLIVPMSEIAASMLGALPPDHPIRSRCLLFAADMPAGDPPARTPASQTPQDPIPEACVLVFYVHGRMVQHYVDQRDQDSGAAMRMLHAAKRKLDSLSWHGPATVCGTISADGAVLRRVEPFFAQSLDSALREGKQFPLLMWQTIRGLPCEPL